VTPPELFLGMAGALLALVSAYLYRLAVGPTVFDRLLGLSGFGTKTTLVFLLIGAVYERFDMFVDVSLAYALLMFIGSLAASRYFELGGGRR
jgi:multicomponent Na+:H+ antiporter subunit F